LNAKENYIWQIGCLFFTFYVSQQLQHNPPAVSQSTLQIPLIFYQPTEVYFVKYLVLNTFVGFVRKTNDGTLFRHPIIDSKDHKYNNKKFQSNLGRGRVAGAAFSLYITIATESQYFIYLFI